MEKAQVVPTHCLASLIGKIMTMALALGLVTQLMTCSLYTDLNCKIAWCQKSILTPEALVESKFWAHEIISFNGQHIWYRPSAVWLVYSDVSFTGYGGCLAMHGNKIINGQWLKSESK